MNFDAENDKRQLEMWIIQLESKSEKSDPLPNKTGLEKLLDSLVHQSLGCNRDTRNSERYILSGIIDYVNKLIKEEKTKGKMYSGKEVADMMKGSYKAGLKESTISDNSYAELLKDRALVSQHNVDLIKDLKAQREQLARKDNKIRLLRKALTRMVGEFETTTPVIPNQKKALEYANNLLQSNDE